MVFEALGALPEIITTLGDRLQAAKDRPWERILISLEVLEQLVNQHVKAIGLVTAPILETGDLLTTCENFRELVNNPDFPTGYGVVRGELEAALQFDQFRKGVVRDKLKTVLGELGQFQYAAFMREYDSYRVADVLELAERLWGLLPAPGQQPLPSSQIAALQTQVRSAFKDILQGLPTEPQAPADIPDLLTSEDVVSLIQNWCRKWQRHVQRTLYGGRGLNYAIGQLRMEHFK